MRPSVEKLKSAVQAARAAFFRASLPSFIRQNSSVPAPVLISGPPLLKTLHDQLDDLAKKLTETALALKHSQTSFVIREKVIRNMKKDELDSFVTPLTKKEGWNIRTGDLYALYAQDPHAFWVLEMDGVPLASLSAISYDRKLAFLGLYLVHPEHRGKGYGKQLWDAVVPRIEPPIGLNGVLAQVPNYEKEGFVTHGHTVRVAINIRDSFDDAGTCSLEEVCPAKITAVADTRSVDAVLKYDRGVFPYDRKIFLKTLMNMPETVTLMATKDKRMMGYGVMRPCVEKGYKIAPLYADDAVTQLKLLKAFKGVAPPKADIYLNAPENRVPYSIGGQFRLFQTALMYKGEPPHLEAQEPRVFSTASIEASPI